MRLIATLLVALLVGAMPATAFAAQAGSAPVHQGGIDVQAWLEAEPGQTVVIVSIEIPDSVELPVRVQLPVIEGMQVVWAGEISGGDPSEDPTREFETEDGEGGSFVEFEVSEFRVAQVELLGLPLQTSGERTELTVPWVQSAEATSTSFSVRLPSGVRDVRITPQAPAPPDRNQRGETLYTLPTFELGTGDTQQIAISYVTGTEFEGGLDGSGRTTPVLVALLAALAAAIVGLVWALRRQSGPPSSPAEEDEEPEAGSEAELTAGSPGSPDAPVSEDDAWFDDSDEPFSTT